MATRLTLHPLTPGRWGDLEAIFTARGCAVARQCWCMHYRVSGRPPWPPDVGQAAGAKAALQALAGNDPPAGLIGYRGRQPVGWISLGPRTDYARLARSPVARPVDEQPVWSVVCFVVPAEHRRQGLARALLDGAIAYARGRGVTLLEAYPVDRRGRCDDAGLWFGTRSMFEQAGFVEVARRRPERPVVRLALVTPPA